ncbi:MAG: hypothetical protein R3C32_09185 [Chloroflexota bacterium]
MEHLDPRPGEYTEQDISPRLWPNGRCPTRQSSRRRPRTASATTGWVIDGLVEDPVELSSAQLHDLPAQEQITQHFCIQGVVRVARWASRCAASSTSSSRSRTPAAVAFYSFAEGGWRHLLRRALHGGYAGISWRAARGMT